MDHERDNWAQMGAGSGLFATLLFVAAFIVFLSTGPAGSTPLPSIEHAQDAPAYLSANLNAVRLEVLLNSLAIVLFLWFVPTVWVALRHAEGEAGRGSMIAVVGATAGGVTMLVGLVLTATAGLSTSLAQAQDVATLYTGSALLFAYGGATLSLFFFGVAKVILRTGMLAKWLGVLAFIAALLCALAFVTPFFATGIFDAATGALGRWAWFAGLVVWVFLASVVLMLGQRRAVREARGPTPPPDPEPGEPVTPSKRVPR